MFKTAAYRRVMTMPGPLLLNQMKYKWHACALNAQGQGGAQAAPAAAVQELAPASPCCGK
jgi:hypothetical protein